MSEGNQPRPITYGAIISISHPNDSNFMIFSDGLIKSRVYLKNLHQNIDKKSSFYRSLFQIYPSFINTYKKDALNTKQEMESPDRARDKKKDNIAELKEKLTLEYKFNLEHYEKVKNTPITFDQTVQFLHLASNKFLACYFVEADIEKENYKLELADVPSDATNFKISPSFKHQKESEGVIYYGDLIFIVHASALLDKIPYLHCSYYQDQVSAEDRNYQINIPDFISHSHSFGGGHVTVEVANKQSVTDNNMVVASLMSYKNNKREVNLSLEKAVRWRINLFDSAHSDDQFLSYGDIIWLNHAEQNSTMICRKQKNDRLEIDFVRSVVSDQFQQYVGNTNGMWIIEHLDYKKGGLVPWDQSFRLRHFSSGQYLTVKFDALNMTYNLRLEPKPTEETKFQFKLLPTAVKQNSQQQKYISRDAFTLIVNTESRCWLHLEQSGEHLEASLSREPKDEDVFKIFRANNNEIWETNFLISCAPMLRNYLDFIRDESKQATLVDDPIAFRKAERKLKNVQVCLTNLDLFCNNKLLNTSHDQKYGEVNSFRQKVLREQYFLEILTEILKNSFTIFELEKVTLWLYYLINSTPEIMKSECLPQEVLKLP